MKKIKDVMQYTDSDNLWEIFGITEERANQLAKNLSDVVNKAMKYHKLSPQSFIEAGMERPMRMASRTFGNKHLWIANRLSEIEYADDRELAYLFCLFDQAYKQVMDYIQSMGLETLMQVGEKLEEQAYASAKTPEARAAISEKIRAKMEEHFEKVGITKKKSDDDVISSKI